jgi:phage baseplate assembly protein W
MIRSKILNAVNLYERRIELNSEDITFTYEDKSVIINMRYFVKAEGIYSTFSLAMLGGE